MMNTPLCKNVLVTGSSGKIGSAVCKELISRGHRVRGFDLARPKKPIDGIGELQIGNLADAEAVNRAVEGVDALIHLAAIPEEADFLTELLEPNVIGVYHILEAARRHRIERIVITSSCQVVQAHNWRQRTVMLDEPFNPISHYGVTKAMAEAWSRYYAEQHKMSVIVVRPGFLPRNGSGWQKMRDDHALRRFYWSHRDAGRLYALCVEVPDIHFAVIYGASRALDQPAFDMEPARKLLGYEPLDTWTGEER